MQHSTSGRNILIVEFHVTLLTMEGYPIHSLLLTYNHIMVVAIDVGPAMPVGVVFLILLLLISKVCLLHMQYNYVSEPKNTQV